MSEYLQQAEVIGEGDNRGNDDDDDGGGGDDRSFLNGIIGTKTTRRTIKIEI